MQVPVAIWVISHPALQADRLHATTGTSQMMLCIAGGFFLHDAVCCMLRESSFYVIHGLTCCLGYVAAAAYGSGHFYGGLFLLWEISTPFVQLRWILHKMALTETGLYMLNSFMMVGSFTLVRVVFGSCAHLPKDSQIWRQYGGSMPKTSWNNACYKTHGRRAAKFVFSYLL